jgi:hypothetical protein
MTETALIVEATKLRSLFNRHPTHQVAMTGVYGLQPTDPNLRRRDGRRAETRSER